MIEQDINIISFLCTGNVFRSAFCEKYFNFKFSGSRYLALSRGTNLFYNLVDDRVVQIAENHKIFLKEHRPISISEDIVILSSKILIMDNSHKQYMLENYPQYLYKVQYLREFYDDTLEIGDVKRSNSKAFDENVANTFTLLSNSIDNMIIE